MGPLLESIHSPADLQAPEQRPDGPTGTGGDSGVPYSNALKDRGASRRPNLAGLSS